MKVRGIFCGTTAATNEEYRTVLKKRNIWMGALILTGALIAGAAWYAEQAGKAALPEYVIGVYCGFGTGLALAGLVLLIRNLIVMGNEGKLKQDRLENSDERIREISNRASRTSLMILVLALVAGGMVGGIFEPILVKMTILLIDVFVLSYIGAYNYYKRKI